MNKKFLISTLLFCFIVFSSYAEYYPDGRAVAYFSPNNTLDDLYILLYMVSSIGSTQMMPFSGELSKAQGRLVWNALGEYDYAPGEVYSVVMQEYGSQFGLMLAVRIEADGSCTWKGYSAIVK